MRLDTGLRPEKRKSRPTGSTVARLSIDAIQLGSGWQLDSTEARKVQLWADALTDSVELWRHRRARRVEGFKP